jgi:hypothetical protein
MLLATSTSWANFVPNVNPPPGAPDWWNNECIWYAYAWWEADLYSGDEANPPNNPTHWASNFLESNEDFYAEVYTGEGDYVYINMQNRYERELTKEIYIYVRGTTESTQGGVWHSFYTAEGTFYGDFGGSINQNGTWWYRVDGYIDPQPSYQYLYVNVPGLTSVTDIWVGENCVPEPATISLLGLGVLSLLRRKRSV